MFRTLSDVESALIEAGIDEADAVRLSSLAKPAVWLESRLVAEDEIAPGTTKLGGRPDLPMGTEWPIRAPYPNAAERAEAYRETASEPEVNWSWATPEERILFQKDNLARAAAVEGHFPLSFLAQINFAEIWAAGPVDPDMPRSGILSVFYDGIEQPWGFDPAERQGFAVIFYDTPTVQLQRLETPSEFYSFDDNVLSWPAQACKAHACVTPLPMETAAYDSLRLSDATNDSLDEWFDDIAPSEEGADWKCHHVGGWPTPVQGDMQTECALVSAGAYCGDAKAYHAAEMEAVRATATDWILIAQIGTDEKGGMMWGDCGQLYVWIMRENLRARRFDRAHIILQCS